MKTLTETRIARLAEQTGIDFGPLSTYRRLIGGNGVPIFTGLQICEPGYMTPMHSHPYVELLFVVEGEAVVYLEGGENAVETLAAGDMVALPAEIPHVFGNAGNRTLRILGIHTSPERIVKLAADAATGDHGQVDYRGDNG